MRRIEAQFANVIEAPGSSPLTSDATLSANCANTGRQRNRPNPIQLYGQVGTMELKLQFLPLQGDTT